MTERINQPSYQKVADSKGHVRAARRHFWRSSRSGHRHGARRRAAQMYASADDVTG